MEQCAQHLRSCHLVSENERKILHIPAHALHLKAWHLFLFFQWLPRILALCHWK